ncbi:rod-binding protein [Azospirillum canadense]|uniref:rod-binding protein n=1 Tax=Azospirillum canadense TaxID=403962 RepID=UPI0022260133|nr:rod-binding protein [Azospirillum canadense]MCW2239948.1 Rod binding domain-containing protein [Azospirillum canadense]
MDVTALPSPAPASVRTAGTGKTPDPAQRAAKDFEAMMVGQMLESMFAGVDAGSAFGGGQGERTWRSFMLQEYGKAIAEAGTLGIGRMVQADVARLYAQQNEGAGA